MESPLPITSEHTFATTPGLLSSLDEASKIEDIATSLCTTLRLTRNDSQNPLVLEVEPTSGELDNVPRCNNMPTLLSLPPELRQKVYEDVFHDPTRCQDYTSDGFLGQIGCRCGEGLSRTNIQLYAETRFRHFQCARFVFGSAQSCLQYLNTVGPIALNIGVLEISCLEENWNSSLRAIFKQLGTSSHLHHLQLVFDTGIPRPGYFIAGPPLYVPSSLKEDFAALCYDVAQRPISHPLAQTKYLQSLVLMGHPRNDRVEEALLKVTLKMQSKAEREHKATSRFYRWDNRGGCGFWLDIEK